MEFRKAYDPQMRVTLDCSVDAGRTKQEFKKDCDINRIVAKYQKTGIIDHARKFSGEYAFATGLDFQAAMELVKNGEEMFAALPSSLRNRFANDPAQFLDFVQDPANAQELVDLGLADPVPVPDVPPAPAEPAPAAEPAPPAA